MFNRKHPIVINDEVFGQMRQHIDGSECRYEGMCDFVLSASKTATIPYFIYTDVGGPTPAQRDFFLRLKSDLEPFIQDIIPMVEAELKLWGKDITIADFNTEFSIAAITFSRAAELPLTWELILNTIHDTNHQIIVDFRGDEPVDILIDV